MCDGHSCCHVVLVDDIGSLVPEPPPSTSAHNRATCLVECNTAEVLAVSRFSVGRPAMLYIVSTSCSSWFSSIAVAHFRVVELRSR